MSTYYFIICDDCHEKSDAASRTAGGYCHLADSEWTLIPFIIAHSEHDVSIINEHDWRMDEDYKEWTKENRDDMISLAKSKEAWFR